MAERTKAFKDMTFKEKVEQIWEYYKPAIFGIIAGIALIIYIIYKVTCPEPESILNVTLVNAMPMQVEGDDMFQRYLKEHGYNPKEETIRVNTNLFIDRENGGPNSAATVQALVAMVMVGEIDILAGNEDVLEMVGVGGGLMEMADILSREQMEAYKDRLYTVTDTETGTEYVCGIKLPEDNPLTQDGYYGKDVWAAIPVTGGNEDLAKEMFLHLLEE